MAAKKPSSRSTGKQAAKKTPGRKGPSSGNASFKDAVKGLKKDWNAAKNADFGGNFAEDDFDGGEGTYTATLDQASCFVRTNGTPVFKTSYVISLGDHKGQRITSFEQLVSQQNLEYVCKRLVALGYAEDEVKELDVEDLEGIAADLQNEKPEVQLYIKEGQPYNGKATFNAYVNKLAN